MPLAGYTSLCEKNARRIISKDRKNPQTHIANNVNSCFVTHYRIDGEVIIAGSRCDYLLINEDKRTVYFIELKGSDICKAAEQIATTERVLADQLNSYPVHKYRIIANRVNTHAIQSSEYRKYQRQWGNRLQQKVKLLEEDI